MSKKIITGGYVASYCTKCKLELGHTVMVLDGEKVKRVKCRTCGSEHNHKEKAKKATAVKKTRGPAAKKAASTKSPEVRWEAANEKAKGTDVPYSLNRSFSASDIVIHEKFGKGFIQMIVPRKITVLFRDKERILVCGN